MSLESEIKACNDYLLRLKQQVIENRHEITDHKRVILMKVLNNLTKKLKDERCISKYPSPLTGDDLAGYKSLFDQTVQHIFKKTLWKSRKTQTKVDVVYRSTEVSFLISSGDTFDDLRAKVGAYWGIPPDKVFFSQGSCIYLNSQNVFEELINWKYVTLRGSRPALNVIYNLTEDFNYEKLYQEVPETEANLIPKIPEEESAFPDFKRRYKTNNLLNLLHTLLLIGLFINWMLATTVDSNIFEASWMNHSLEQAIMRVPYATSSLYPVGPGFAFLTSQWDFWSYLNREKQMMFLRIDSVYPGDINLSLIHI